MINRIIGKGAVIWERIGLSKLVTQHSTLARFSLMSTANQICTMLAGIVIIAWVTPGELGIWKSVQIIQSYAAIAQAGVVHGLNRELPFRVGRGDNTVIRLASTAQTFTFCVVSVLLVIAFSSLLFPFNVMVRFSLFAIFVMAAISTYENYLYVTYRADQGFDKLSKINMYMAFLELASLSLVYFIGYYGIPIRLMLLGLIRIVALHITRPMHSSISFDRQDFKTLLKIGVPLFICGYLNQTAYTFPNMIILFNSGTQLVGVLAPALSVFGLMTLLPGSISQYVYARMSFRFGQTGDLNLMWAHAWKTSLGTLAMSVPIVIFVFFAYPPLVSFFFPKYSESIPAVIWISLAGLFYGSQMASSALNSIKAWRWIFVLTVSRLLLAFILPFAGYYIMKKNPLVGVSVGYAMAGLLSFIVCLGCAYFATHPKTNKVG